MIFIMGDDILISDDNFDFKLDKLSYYMMSVYKDIKQNNVEIDNKSNNMIVLLGVMISLQSTVIFTAGLKPNLILLLSLLFYFIGLILFVYSYYLKKFYFSPNNNQLIDYGKNHDISSEQMLVSLNCDLNEAINNNIILLNKKSKTINYGMWGLVIGIFFTVLFIITYFIV